MFYRVVIIRINRKHAPCDTCHPKVSVVSEDLSNAQLKYYILPSRS